MSCSTPITRNIRSQTFTNWARTIEFTSNESYRPRTRGEIVEIIRIAEEENLSVKWSGSRWSFMAAFVSDDIVIESNNIFGLVEINRSNSDPEERKVLSHLTLRRNVDSSTLVHVKGGTKIFNVNRLLHGLDLISNNVNHTVPDDEFSNECNENMLAMPTLGGSGGQAIAGALSTGTHGGDILLAPIADVVAAIHLIGPGGQEWWIEKNAGITAGTEEETQAELEDLVTRFPDAGIEMCDDIIVRKDDDFFHSVLVSMGRMGFIYSLVLNVRTKFKLTERRRNDIWETFRNNLTNITSLRNFDSTHPDSRLRVANIHYLNIVIMPFSDNAGRHVCKISTREIHEGSCDELPDNDGVDSDDGGFNIFNWICGLADVRVLLIILIPALGVLVASSIVLSTTIEILASIPLVGWVLAAGAIAMLAALTATIAALSALITFLSFRGGRTIREVIAALTDFSFRFGLKELMISALTSLFNSVYPVTKSDGSPLVKTGFSFKIMDTYGYNEESFCEKVDSMDFAFNAFQVDGSGRPVYFSFIDQVLLLFDEMRNRNVAIAGNLALRYSRNTNALLGISRFTTTAYIEIATIRDFPGNSEFVIRVQEIAKRLNGIPSWGQLFNHYNALDIRNIYGENLITWRTTLTELIRRGDGKDFTFSNNFTQTYNLEPWDDTVISAILVDITVGDDSLGDTDPLRPDVSQDFVYISVRGLEFIEISLNENTTWNAFTRHTRRIDLPLGVMWSDVEMIGIRHVAAGHDWNADNWTMNRVIISSISSDGSTRERVNLEGNPIWQFQKNANQVWEHFF